MSKHVLKHEIELYREGDAYVVLVEMNDYDRDELDLTWHDNHLHIEAAHVDEAGGRTQLLQRSLSVPKPVDHEHITAKVDGDTLEVRLPIEAEGDHERHEIQID